MAYDYESAVVWSAGWASPYLGQRFDSAGRFLPETGNTVVAQVVPGSATEAALIRLRGALQALPHGGHFAYTEVASYHMTVFEGVIDTRRVAEAWPAGLALDLPIPETTAAMMERLAVWQALPDFAMRITEVTPFGLRLTGATAEDEAVARDWRDGLSAALGLRTPKHSFYGFHTTVAYC
ncbi:MAG: DUF1868 domain-containing protein, partial [Paracoccaceae bacterium]